MAFHHLAFATRNLEETHAFYTDVMGFTLAKAVAKLLNLRGNSVRAAYDGPSALETAAAFQPNVVLLDIGLPGMNGYEVAKRIREQPQLQNVVLIALTGWGQEADRRRSHEAGFDHHLVKPVGSDKLHALLRAIRS